MISSEKGVITFFHISGARLIARSGHSSDAWAEDRLQVLEQLVTGMQVEVLSARSAAAQAEQRATDAITRVLGVRGEGVVEGTTDNWRLFKFTFSGYAGAVDSRVKQAMTESEVLQEAAITNSAYEAQCSCTSCWYCSWEAQRDACWNKQAMSSVAELA